jgi:hypothetical protein
VLSRSTIACSFSNEPFYDWNFSLVASRCRQGEGSIPAVERSVTRIEHDLDSDLAANRPKRHQQVLCARLDEALSPLRPLLLRRRPTRQAESATSQVPSNFSPPMSSAVTLTSSSVGGTSHRSHARNVSLGPGHGQAVATDRITT